MDLLLLGQQLLEPQRLQPVDQFARHPVGRVAREQSAHGAVEVPQDDTGALNQLAQPLGLFERLAVPARRFRLIRIGSH
ncbi:hypothetical protein STPH1_3900 [Streptomyces sp. OM5714]|nr:hypothetical protein STPH1_3900 [Streptomyces sp. OM5714]